MTQTTKRQERTEQFKLKDVEMHFNADGAEVYGVVVYPKFRNGWSNYTRDMFLWGDDPKALFHKLGNLKGSVVTLNIVSGKVKQNKQDDGQFESYFWNVDSIVEVQAPPSQTPAAKAPSATEKPQGAAPPAPVPWDAADTQSRISWAQAVNLAVQVLGSMEAGQGFSLLSVESWANRFYPLIRKGPSPQAEPDPWDEAFEEHIEPDGHGNADVVREPTSRRAQEGHQEATGEAPAPGDGKLGGSLPPWPLRGEKEAAVNYFIKAAKERFVMTQKEALAAIGGTWSGWVDKNGGDGEQALVAAWALLGSK